MNRRGEFLELLAPAKNADFGVEAVEHGADAVYIGGPAFGARAGAGNPVADIERLARHAHRFGARVLVALNTILKDEELESARRLAWQCFEAGADALIVQDMGLLELDLPPIELHASTQSDIRTPEKARFLEDVGFSQIVLARELSLEQIRAIAERTTVTLEFFIHGALCVAYSGLCNLSQARTGRSANRGDCSQACRLPYTLAYPDGVPIAKGKHLLSLKDNDQSANLRALIEAGVRSFKIEGRLKDLAYVKNVTAHYRQRLDALLGEMPGLRRASSGRCDFLFTPQPGKTFNRGATDYFVRGRQSGIGAFDSPKFAGEEIGKIVRLGVSFFEVESTIPLHNGDGLCYFNAGHGLAGLRVNAAEPIHGGWRLHPALVDGKRSPGLKTGLTVWRNHDQEFLRQLERPSAHRKIDVRLRLEETPDGFALALTDEDGVCAIARLAHPKEAAKKGELALAALRAGLGKFGGTIYRAQAIELALAAPYFLPAAFLNALRRAAVAALDVARHAARRRSVRRPAVEPPAAYPAERLDYLGQVFNEKARAFYARHGVKRIDAAFECGRETGAVSLMIAKHCLRYSFNLCPKEVKGLRPDPLLLINAQDRLSLRFDCKSCVMHVVGRTKTKGP